MDPNADAKKSMNQLDTQEKLEEILQRKSPKPLTIIYFTAKWCGPCKALNLAKVLNSFKGIEWYLCDIDENDYSAGYCGIRSIPSFLAIKNGKPLQPITQSNPDKVIEWISTLIK